VAPILTHVTATASGASSSNYGISDVSTDSLILNDVNTKGLGGSDSYGFYSQSSTQITLTNMTAYASGINYSIGLYSGYTNAALTNIVATGSGGATYNRGITLDSNGTFTQTLTNVIATATGGGGANYALYDYGVNATINNCTLNAVDGSTNYGLYIFGGSDPAYMVTINNSQITGDTATIRNSTKFTTRVGGSFLNGGNVVNGSTMTCAGVYDENFTFSPSTCP
jgi:hypothetical protein